MARCPNINLPEWKQLVAAKTEHIFFFFFTMVMFLHRNIQM